MQSALYGALTTYSFYEAGLNPNPVALASAAMLLLSTAESTVIQTPWDAYNQHKTQTAISARPERVRRYLVLSSLGSLALSFANVTAVGLNIGGGIYGTLLSAVVGTGGWYVWGKESGLKVPQSVLELRDRLARSGKTAVQTCRGLLSQLF